MGVAIFAFITGVFVFYVRPLFIPVPLSEIEDKLALYKSREIRVNGYFIAEKSLIGDFYLYQFEDDSNKCTEDSQYCFSEAIVVISEEIKKKESQLINELVDSNYIYALGDCDSKMRECNLKGRFGAKVEITGDVEERPAVFSGTRIFVIKLKDIKQTSPIDFIRTRK